MILTDVTEGPETVYVFCWWVTIDSADPCVSQTMSAMPSVDLLAFFLHPDKRAFFIICTSELGPPQIYELVALTSSDKNM